MQKISFRNVLAQCIVGTMVIFLAFIGSFLIREARSFVNPASGTGASGVLGQDVGVIGNPTDGIAGASTLFQGQAAIKTAVDAIGGGGDGGLRTKRVFVTSTTYDGNLGGLAGADAKCQARANAATLGGTWKAILGDSTITPQQRTDYNWDYLVDLWKRPIVAKWELWSWVGYDGSGQIYLREGIGVTELGTGGSGIALVGSGCNGWTTNDFAIQSSTGVASDRRWNWYNSTFPSPCNQTGRLYCIEQ